MSTLVVRTINYHRNKRFFQSKIRLLQLISQSSASIHSDFGSARSSAFFPLWPTFHLFSPNTSAPRTSLPSQHICGYLFKSNFMRFSFHVSHFDQWNYFSSTFTKQWNSISENILLIMFLFRVISTAMAMWRCGGRWSGHPALCCTTGKYCKSFSRLFGIVFE